MAPDFIAALSEQKFAEAARVVDVAISTCRPDDKEALAQLLVNRGYCQQKIQLYRKALKVRPVCRVDPCHAPRHMLFNSRITMLPLRLFLSFL